MMPVICCAVCQMRLFLGGLDGCPLRCPVAHVNLTILSVLFSDLRHIEQNERVSMGLNGNLYFSNTLLSDSHDDYCCFASFSRIRTIVQKPRMALKVKPSTCQESP